MANGQIGLKGLFKPPFAQKALDGQVQNMNKLMTTIKRLLRTEKARQYAAAVVMAGLFSPLAISGAPMILAEDRNNNDITLLALEATTNPNKLVIEDEEADTFLQNGIFIQANCLPGTFCLNDNQVLTIKSNLKQVIVTAYSSTRDQTDRSPFITANGTYVYDGVMACNFLPFGTKVKLPEIYGDKIFTVEDRMARKNSHKMDIWMPSYSAAMQFGVKRLAIEILE